MENSVFFAPDQKQAKLWLGICAQYCQARDYALVGVATTWIDALKMIVDGHATVLIVGRRDHIPSDRSPRLEVIAEAVSSAIPIAQQRPRRRDRTVSG